MYDAHKVIYVRTLVQKKGVQFMVAAVTIINIDFYQWLHELVFCDLLSATYA